MNNTISLKLVYPQSGDSHLQHKIHKRCDNYVRRWIIGLEGTYCKLTLERGTDISFGNRLGMAAIHEFARRNWLLFSITLCSFLRSNQSFALFIIVKGSSRCFFFASCSSNTLSSKRMNHTDNAAFSLQSFSLLLFVLLRMNIVPRFLPLRIQHSLPQIG